MRDMETIVRRAIMREVRSFVGFGNILTMNYDKIGAIQARLSVLVQLIDEFEDDQDLNQRALSWGQGFEAAARTADPMGGLVQCDDCQGWFDQTYATPQPDPNDQSIYCQGCLLAAGWMECEGCGAIIGNDVEHHSDPEGVELCASCWASLVEESRSQPAEAAIEAEYDPPALTPDPSPDPAGEGSAAQDEGEPGGSDSVALDEEENPEPDARICPWGCNRTLKGNWMANHFCGNRVASTAPVAFEVLVPDTEHPIPDTVAAESLVMCPYCKRGWPDLERHYDDCEKRAADKARQHTCSHCGEWFEYVRSSHRRSCETYQRAEADRRLNAAQAMQAAS